MSTTKTIFAPKTDTGLRLADSLLIIDAIANMNGAGSTYGIAAAGTTQAGATKLGSVYNQVDTTAAASGVALPLSTGKRNVPFQFCIVVNNGANALQVYSTTLGTDTINGVAGSTGITQVAGTTVLYVSVKNGAWFALTSSATGTPSATRGTFTANGVTPATVTNANVTANSAIVITLKTVGGTVGAIPAIQTITPSTGFTVAATAADTSVYNYLIIG